MTSLKSVETKLLDTLGRCGRLAVQRIVAPLLTHPRFDSWIAHAG